MRVASTSICVPMLLFAVWLGAMHAAEPGKNGENSPPAQSRLPEPAWSVERRFVPAGRPEDWPRDPTARYVPMAADEFESRLAKLNGCGKEAGAEPLRSVLDRAEYRAELRDDHCLAGQAVWNFTQQNGKHELVRLEGSRLALGNCRWMPEQATAQQKPSDPRLRAVVGNDENGDLYALIDRSGKMTCSWSVQGTIDAAGAMSFALALPECPLNSVELSLPTGFSPIVEHGVVVPQADRLDGRRIWRIELGGNGHQTLRIVNSKSLDHGRGTSVVRPSFVYKITPRGLEVAADIKLDVLGAPLRQIRVQADGPLNVVTARMGETELNISKVASKGADPSSESAGGEYSVDLPEPIQGAGRLLRIAAIAPVSWDSLWRLPLLHFPGARWQEGAARLIVSKPLLVNELRLKNCRQTETERLNGPVDTESLGIQFFDENPDIQLATSFQRAKVLAKQGVSIELRANEGTGVVHAEFTAAEGETLALEAEVAPHWMIDNVVSVPAGFIADWSQESPRDRAGKLSVQLRSPLTRQQSIHLVISARRRRAPWSDVFQSSDLALLKFKEATTVRRIIHVQALEPFQLRTSGDDELNRLDPAALSAADQALIDAKAPGLVFVDDQRATSLNLTLAATAPQYDAEIRCDVLATDTRLVESYRFTIIPSGRELRRFQIRFSQPRGESIAWSTAEDPQAPLSVKRLPGGESGAAEIGETYEVALPVAASAPFVLLANRETQLGDDTPIALASLVDAENQRGTVQVRSIARVPPEVNSRRRLSSVPIEPPPEGEYATAIAAFQYNPAEQSALSSDAPLVLTASRGAAVRSQAWIWQADLASNVGRDNAEHALTCRIENTGLSRIRFQSPPGARLRSVSIDGREVSNSNIGDGDSWPVRLPPGDRFVTVILRFSGNEALPRTVSPLTAPWPIPDIPVLASSWTVAVPKGVVLTDCDIPSESIAAASLRKRLFGPLARSEENSISANSAPTSLDRAAEPEEANLSARLQLGSGRWENGAEKSAFAAPAGWNRYHFSDFENHSATVWMVDQTSMSTKAWTLFVIMFAARWWIGRRGFAFDVAVLGLATCIALTVPVRWSPIVATSWLGIAAATLLVWTTAARKSSRDRQGRSTAPSATGRAVAVTTAGCLLVVAAWQTISWAQEPREVGPSISRRASEFHVLVPVDEKNQPANGVVYLPDVLYQKLLQNADAAPARSPSWLLLAANYRADLRSQTAAAGLASSHWECAYELESFVDRADVRLPLGEKGAVLIPDGVQLDGNPQPFHWNPAAKAIEISAVSTGTHQLVVKVHPLVDRLGCSFTIPSVASSRVELTIPHSAAIELPAGINIRRRLLSSASTNSDTREADSDQFDADLGPVNQLLLRDASSITAVSSAPAAMDADELYWLHIRPGSVAVDARWKLNVRSGRVKQLRLSVDPRWRPLPPAEGSAIAQFHPAPDDANVLLIDLARPVVGRSTIDASFLLVGGSGVGEWRQPPFALQDLKVSRRRFAVSIDDSLDFVNSGIGNSAIRSEQFAALWGGADPAPQLAWRAVDAVTGALVKTRPPVPQLNARYQLAILAGLNELTFGFTADLGVTHGPLFELMLRVPKQLEIEAISVYDGPAARPARWARSRPDLVTIFFESPMLDTRQIRLLGRMPTPSNGLVSIPDFHMEGSTGTGSTILLLRRPDARLEMHDSGAAVRLSDSDTASMIDQAVKLGVFGSAGLANQRIVVAQSFATNFVPISMSVLSNQPKLKVRQLTKVDRTADGWIANADFDCTLADGILDELRVDVPPNWKGPSTVSPMIPFSIDEVVGENRQQLVLRPETPWVVLSTPQRFSVEISGPLSVASGERPAAPDIRTHNRHADTTAFVLLPRQMENQQLSWDTVGLMFKPLPRELAERIANLNAYRAYQATGQKIRASLRSIERNGGNPRITQEDIAYRWRQGGRTQCVAEFDIVSVGLQNCILELPANSQFVSARLDLAPAQVVTAGPNRYSVWLGDQKLPRRLEVIFTGAPASSAGSPRFEPPRLVDWPVEKTLWTVVAPAEAGHGAISNATPISALRLARSRYEATAAIFETAAETLLDKTSADIENWNVLWARRYAAARAEFRAAKLQSTVDDQLKAIDAQIATTDDQHARLLERMGIKTAIANSPGSISPAPDVIDLFTDSPDVMASYASVRGGGEPLQVEYPKQIRATSFGRFMLAGCVGFISLGAVFMAARRKHWAMQRVHVRPEIAAAVVGLVWWMCFSPRLLGLGILFASLGLMLSRWQIRSWATRHSPHTEPAFDGRHSKDLPD